MLTTKQTKFSVNTQWLACITLTVCAFAIPISVTATTITFLLAWVLILISGNWSQRWQLIRSNPAAISFWVLFCLFIFGLIYTSSPGHLAFKDLQKRHWLLIAPFFMMVITNDRWRRHMLNAFLAAMVLTAILSYLRFFNVTMPLALTKHLRSGANVFFEHIVQSFFMSLAAFILGYRFFYESSKRNLNLLLFLLLTINVLFLSKGRTGYLQIILLLLFLCLLRFKVKGALIAIAIGAVTVFCAYQFSHNFNSRVSVIASDINQYKLGHAYTPIGIRIAMWHDAIALIKQHPWLGYGTGGIKTAMETNLPQHMIDRTGPIDYVENSYLNFMLQFGVIGLLTLLAFISSLFYASTRLPTQYRHLIQGFLIAYLAGSLINSFFVSFCEAHLFALFAAICFSSYSSKKHQTQQGITGYETT